MNCFLISTAHPYYASVLALRQLVLREPLGLDLYEEDLSDEVNQVIAVVEESNTIIACLLAKKISINAWKLRQMAVLPEFRQQGVGQALMLFIEKEAQGNAINHLELHARETAIPFYEKLGFVAEGPIFMEVGIPHRFMQKML